MISKDRTYKPSVRVVNNMTIYFASREAVYIEMPNKMVVVIHRWGSGRKGYTKQWKPFIERLKRHKIGDIYDIVKFANRYDLGFITSNRPMPEIPSGTIKLS